MSHGRFNLNARSALYFTMAAGLAGLFVDSATSAAAAPSLSTDGTVVVAEHTHGGTEGAHSHDTATTETPAQTDEGVSFTHTHADGTVETHSIGGETSETKAPVTTATTKPVVKANAVAVTTTTKPAAPAKAAAVTTTTSAAPRVADATATTTAAAPEALAMTGWDTKSSALLGTGLIMVGLLILAFRESRYATY